MLMGGIALIYTGCNFEQEDLFPESAAQRLENAKKETKELLVSAPNGWVMQYFPKDTKKGYTMLMKFENSGLATIAGKNSFTLNKYSTDDSMYEMIADHGPVLTFNTYNEILHAFSNPQNPTGLGQEGDYEFVIMEKDPSEIKLQGKKRETDIRLLRLGDDVNWENYFTQIDAMNTNIFGGVDNALQYIAGDQIALASGGLNGIFVITEDGQLSGDATNMPIIITPTGLKLYEPFTFNGKTAQHFTLNAEKTRLIADEDASVYISGPALSNYISSSKAMWKFVDMGSAAQTALDAMAAGFNAQYGGKRDLDYIAFNSTAAYAHSFAVKVMSTALTNFKMDMTANGDDEIIISFPETIDTDSNGNRFYKEVPQLGEFMNALAGTYKVSTEQPFIVSQIKYVKTDDSNFYFTVNQ